MIHGISTDNKKYKHINRNEIKWLCKDLHYFKRITEKYIDHIRPDDEKEPDKSLRKMMTVDRVIAIIFLGIFGSATLVTGIYLLMKGTYLMGVPLSIFGVVFVLAFFLFERYR